MAPSEAPTFAPVLIVLLGFCCSSAVEVAKEPAPLVLKAGEPAVGAGVAPDEEESVDVEGLLRSSSAMVVVNEGPNPDAVRVWG